MLISHPDGKTDGLPEAAKIQADVQLSSPVEEATISSVFDPASAEEGATPPEGAAVVFRGVETSVATISISAKDADIPLGSSALHDVAPLCAVDAMKGKEEYVKDFSAEIMPNPPAADPTEGEEVPQLEAVCTLTFRVTFKPSAKDQQEELYEMLNKTSQRKASALETLRSLSSTLARSQGPSSAESSDATGKPAVKAGFLNKKKKEPTKFEKFYEKTIGPNSILRKSAMVALSARNFIIFFGASVFFHFQGQMLSLPPPA